MEGSSAMRHGDVARSLALVGEANASPTPEDFPRRVLSLLRAFLRADIASFMRSEPDAAPVWAFDPVGVAFPTDRDAMAAFAAEHPLVSHYARSRETAARRLSDFLTLRQFQRLDVYDVVFRPLGAKYQLAAPISLEGPFPTGFGVTRLHSDFNERERALLDLVRPQIAAAYRNVRARHAAARRLAALERGLDDGGRAVVVLRGGRLEPQSAAAAALLDRWFGDSLPPLPASGSAVVVERDDARLRMRLVDGELLLLDETRLAPDAERARVLGLTRRETEILALAARGLTDAAIAAELFVSIRTVHKHLEHAYRKLGVGSRREAVDALLEH